MADQDPPKANDPPKDPPTTQPPLGGDQNQGDAEKPSTARREPKAERIEREAAEARADAAEKARDEATDRVTLEQRLQPASEDQIERAERGEHMPTNPRPQDLG